MKLLVLLKLILGFLALLMAAVGLLLPIWPTTPFVLLAIGCFSSMPAMRNRLLRISFFREYYESYTAGKGVGRKTVWKSVAFLWIMLVISMVFAKKLWVVVLLSAVGTCVSAHICCMSEDWKRRKKG